MALSELKIRNAKPEAKAYKIADERGLYLIVQPQGSKLWRWNYRIAGKQKTLSIGRYPDVGLASARRRLAEAREQLSAGADPSEEKKAAKQAALAPVTDSFEAVAKEWMAKFSPGWAQSHSYRIKRRLERDLYPWLGSRSVREIEPKELLDVLRKIEARGRLETAHRAMQNAGQVFRYAVSTGRAQRNPSADLRGALAPWRPKHYASITDPKAIGDAVLKAVEARLQLPEEFAALARIVAGQDLLIPAWRSLLTTKLKGEETEKRRLRAANAVVFEVVNSFAQYPLAAARAEKVKMYEQVSIDLNRAVQTIRRHSKMARGGLDLRILQAVVEPKLPMDVSAEPLSLDALLQSISDGLKQCAEVLGQRADIYLPSHTGRGPTAIRRYIFRRTRISIEHHYLEDMKTVNARFADVITGNASQTPHQSVADATKSVVAEYFEEELQDKMTFEEEVEYLKKLLKANDIGRE